MLKNISKILKKYRLILIINIAGIISFILAFITPTTKIYHVNFIFKISNDIEYQRLFNSRELNKEDLYLEITETINQILKLRHTDRNWCKIVLKNNSYNTFKYKNLYLLEFQSSHNEVSLNAINKCYDEFEKYIAKTNENYLNLTRFIYNEKYEILSRQYNKSTFALDLEYLLNTDAIKLNKNIITLSKQINETKNLFDNKISRFFSYFIILSFLFTILVNYKKFVLLIKKKNYLK
jgi:hypothetical protein